MDDKGRVVLPKKLRESLKDPAVLYVTPGPDHSLWVYTEVELELLAAKLDEAPATDAEARVFRRLYFAQTESVDIDKAGRFLIPERLSHFALLKKDVVLIGVRNHLEIWDSLHWETYVNQQAVHFDTVAEKAFAR